MKFAITGANCFVGSHLLNKLQSEGNEVFAIVRENSLSKLALKELNNVHVVELNMEHYTILGAKVGSIDCLINLAWAGTRGLARLDEELQKSNYVNTLMGINSVIDAGCQRVITAGSQAEYGINDSYITEETICNPNTAYGKYKLKLFEDATKICNRNGVLLKEPRYFSLYGPGDYANTLVMSTIAKLLKNEVCDFTQAIQKWDFLYIDDAIDALIKLCTLDCADGAYNFGSGDCRVLKDYIEEMKLVLGSKSELNYGSIPYSKEGMVSINPCIDKIKQETNWKPSVSFAEGINRIKRTVNGIKKID